MICSVEECTRKAAGNGRCMLDQEDIICAVMTDVQAELGREEFVHDIMSLQL